MDTKTAITNFIFVDDEIVQADVIILPGSSHKQLVDRAIELYKQEKAPLLLFTGGFSEKLGKPESEWAKEIAINMGIPESSILIESKSTNTKENAIEALSLLKKRKIKFEKVILVAKTYHSRRLLMSFSKVFTDNQLMVSPVVENREITKENWTANTEKIATVMEEVGKISEYYLKGDLGM